jgi:hypothetical protein
MCLSTRHAVDQLPTNPRPHSLHCGLQVRTMMAPTCISKLARLVLRNALNHSLHVYCHTATITDSRFVRSFPPSSSRNLLNHNIGVHLEVYPITASKLISKPAQSWPWIIYLRTLDGHFQVQLKLLSSTACSQSIYTVGRWVAI